MQAAADQESFVNPHQERSLLPAPAMAAWSGFPLAWVEAGATAIAGAHTLERTLLATLDHGSALADFGYRGRSRSLDLRAGAIGVFAAGTHMRHCRWRCENVRRIMVELDFDRLSAALPLEDLPRIPIATEFEFRDPALAAMLRAMVREAAEGCPNGPLFAQSLSVGLAMRLQQRAPVRDPRCRERGKLAPAQAQRVEELVRAQLATGISLGVLAQAAGFSTAQFVRLFKNTFGCTPHRYVLRMRLARSRELVLASQLTLAAIAHETGFASQSHMTSAFVRAFRVPPGEMRRAQ